ncbi:MAG: hypothetical protein ACHQ7M_01280 [Chloroflexota bacterium]
MPEDPAELPEDELLGFAELLDAVPPWEPDPAWFRSLRAKLMAADLPETDQSDM